MFARLSRMLLVLALAGSIGLHWTVFQAIAWAGMMVSYSQNAPLTEAVVKTFNGEHPCSLCKQIDKGKQKEKKADYKFEANKVKLAYAPLKFAFDASQLFWEIGSKGEIFEVLTHSPPLPPPRGFFS